MTRLPLFPATTRARNRAALALDAAMEAVSVAAKGATASELARLRDVWELTREARRALAQSPAGVVGADPRAGEALVRTPPAGPEPDEAKPAAS